MLVYQKKAINQRIYLYHALSAGGGFLRIDDALIWASNAVLPTMVNKCLKVCANASLKFNLSVCLNSILLADILSRNCNQVRNQHRIEAAF